QRLEGAHLPADFRRGDPAGARESVDRRGALRDRRLALAGAGSPDRTGGLACRAGDRRGRRFLSLTEKAPCTSPTCNTCTPITLGLTEDSLPQSASSRRRSSPKRSPAATARCAIPWCTS